MRLYAPVIHRWSFPLSGAGVSAEIRIRGWDPTFQEIQMLARFAGLIARTWPEEAALPTAEDLDPLNIGDIVQLRPSADPVFGVMLIRLSAGHPVLRGYFLTPHSGGNRMAWSRLKSCEVGRIGTLRWKEAEWGFRHWV